MTIKGRRTGLGVTAEGDMIAAMGLRYGTDEATDFSEEVHKILKLYAYRSSVIMAQERGAFPIYDAMREVQNPFIDRINKEDSDLYLAYDTLWSQKYIITYHSTHRKCFNIRRKQHLALNQHLKFSINADVKLIRRKRMSVLIMLTMKELHGPNIPFFIINSKHG